MGHVVTFGEMLMRLSPPGDERLLQSGQLHAGFGGCEANVAVGLSQFGVPVEYISCLPANAIGDAALRVLKSEGVRVPRVVRSGARMGLYYLERGADIRPLRSVYDREHSGFATALPSAYDFAAALQGAAWLHVSGIVPALGASANTALQMALSAAHAANVRVSFDLNFRKALWHGTDPRPVVEPYLAQVDLLIGNPEAIEVMAGETTSGTMPEQPEALLQTAQRLHSRFGCKAIAITQREVITANMHAWQAWLWEHDADQLHHGGRYQVEIVDRVGGGDAFVAGLLAALFRGSSAQEAVRFGTAACALKHTVPGDLPRTSTTEVDALVARKFG